MDPIKVTLARSGAYWQARWTGTDGKRMGRGLGKRSDSGGKVTERQADTLRRALEHSLSAGTVAAGTVPQLADHVTRFLANRPELSAGSRYLYGLTAQLLGQYLGSDRRLDRVTADDAADWRGALARGELTGKIPATSTVCRHVREAKALFAAAKLPSNPFDGLSGKAPAPDKTWATVSPADLVRIMDACPSDGWRALFALAGLAGLRKGEALALRWAHVDLDRRRLTVVNPTGQVSTKKRVRQVPIVPELHALLWELWMSGPAGDMVIDGLPGEGSLWRACKQIIRRSGVPVYRKPLHTLRKNRETTWAGEFPFHVVAEWLGNSPVVALEHYTRAVEEDFAKAARIERPEGKPSCRPVG